MARQHLAAGALFVALTLAMTWPLAPNLGRAVSDPGDPFINTWILDWDFWATLHQPLSLFHANLFHPAKYTLALSENLYGVALLLMPLRLAGVPPLAAYNIAMLAGFALCGFGAYLLGSRLTGSFAAGLAAGAFYAFVPFRWVHVSHVQHAWGGWLPLMLWALVVYVERPTPRRAAVFAALFVMNGLTNIHYLFFGALTIGATVALMMWVRHSCLTGPGQTGETGQTGVSVLHEFRALFIATGIGAILLAPFLYPYLAVAKLYGMQRGWQEVLSYSAIPSDWLRSGPQVRLYAGLLDPTVDPERWLFPGALSLLLSAIGLVIARREKGKVALALLWIAIGFCGSLGLNFEFHSFLFGAVPGFRAIRAPARWAVIAYIGISILVALTTAALARRNRWLALVVPLLFVIELRVAPLRWSIALPQPRPVAIWLRTQRGVIAHLPMHKTASYNYMLWATAHHRPMVNGVSGFTPPVAEKLAGLSSLDPIPDAFVDELRRLEVEHIVVHADLLGHQGKTMRDWLRRELVRGRLAFVRRFDGDVGGDWVFLTRGQRAEGGGQRPEGGGQRAEGRGQERGSVASSSALRPLPSALSRFLADQQTRNEGTFGSLDFPTTHFVFNGKAIFSGYALSPHGIRKVDLLFNNGAFRVPAELRAEPSLHVVFPWYPDVPRPRFVGKFDRRPPGVWTDTDVQVEITDGRGRTTRLADRFFTWR